MFMSGSAVDDLALLILQESYSLPVLLYMVVAVSLRSRQIDELNVCWNNVINHNQ